MDKNLTLDEIRALGREEDLDVARKHIAFRATIKEKSAQYLGAPISDRPSIQMNWDTAKESQRHSLDGYGEEGFEPSFSGDFLLGYIDLTEIDSTLRQFSHRDEDEIWKVGSRHELAYLIAYISEGHPISPLLIKLAFNNEIIFNGDHHRYAIAKVIGEKRRPVLALKAHRAEQDKKINIEQKL